MIRRVLIPENTGQKYYESHYLFFRGVMEAAGAVVEVQADLPAYETAFAAEVDGRRVFIDFSDHWAPGTPPGSAPVFRFHYSRERHGAQAYPFSPISFPSWPIPKITYRPESWSRILNAQRPGGAALERRQKVQAMLREWYPEDFDTEITDQAGFWRRGGDCLVAVCVPGARPDILDRGQLQLMAFGVCTVSPVLEIDLPWGRTLRPGVDYLACRPDYSNLREAIEYVRKRPETARGIGRSAQELFESCLAPAPLARWIEHCLGGQG